MTVSKVQVLALSAAAGLCVAFTGLGKVPWPRGNAPSPTELDDLLADALDLADRERFEEFLEATESGEDSEHIRAFQWDIDAGRYDLERLFLFGDAAFEHEFRHYDGYGTTRLPRMQRVHSGVYGGLDTFSCNGCHSLGGVNGAGRATATSFYFGDGERISRSVLRNPPAVLGLGMVQALGAEMSADFDGVVYRARAAARASGKPATEQLVAKGVDFGSIVAHPNGELDTSGVEGVDEDLVVKPFGWKGHTARLRRFGERAARIHFGIQSHPSAEVYRDDPDVTRMGMGPDWWDPDGDGKQRELEEGTLTALALYMAMLEVPVIIPPHDPGLQRRWAAGSELFDRLGCVSCHRRTLHLNRVTWVEEPDTTDGEGVELNLLLEGESPRGTGDVALFSDLKRHDMGETLADPVEGEEGIGRSVFLTRPLWGLAETAPYLHDGRAATVLEAIEAHGGEAATQRGRFMALSDHEKGDLHIFLLSLTRQPKLQVAR